MTTKTNDYKQDLAFAEDFFAAAFEKFREELAERHVDGVSYSYAYTMWNLAIKEEAAKGWNVNPSRIGEMTE